MNNIFLINVLFLLAYETNAYAYLDPGTGSIILQAILGLIATVGATVTFYWRKIKVKFKDLFNKKNDNKNNSQSN